MSTIAQDAARIRVSDIVAPSLVIKGPLGSGAPMTLAGPVGRRRAGAGPDGDARGHGRRARQSADGGRGVPLDSCLEARGDPRAHLAPHRGERRADRAHHRGRGRQAAQGRPRRGEARSQHVPLGERRVQAHGRRPHRDGRRPERGAPLRLDDPRAARRDRRDLAVQLPPQPGGAQGRAGAGRRQRRRAQAGLQHSRSRRCGWRSCWPRPASPTASCKSSSARGAPSATRW